MSALPGSAALGELLDRRSRRLRILILGVSVGSSLGLAVYAWTRLLPPRPYGLADDFRVFYAAARMLAEGRDPYRLGALQLVEQQVTHYPQLQPTLDRFPYLPITATVLEPLTRLPFWVAYGMFSGIGVVALVVTMVLLGRDLGWTKNAALAFGVVISWISVLGFSSGQFDALMVAVVAGAMLAAWHERPLVAGLVLGLMWIKPDLIWPAPIFLFLALRGAGRPHRWFALGWLLTSALCLASSPQWLIAWAHALRTFAQGVGGAQPDLAGLPGLLGAAPRQWGLGSGLLAPGTLVVVALALLAMGVFALWMMLGDDWRRVSQVGRISWGVALPLAVWLAATPYAHPNDDLLLLPLFLATVGRDARRVHGQGLALALSVTAWLLLIWPAGVVPWGVGLLVMAALAGVLWYWRTDVRLTGFGAGACVLTLALLPAVWPFHLLKVGLAPVAVMVLVVEGARTCWMEVGGAGTGPAYVTDPAANGGLASLAGGG